jgi:fido (protein-threonine AMPylation protein)
MKISIRFFNDQEVRAIWDDEHSQWRFSVLDIVGVLNEEPNYTKTRNYWKYLKSKLKKQNSQLVSATTQLKLTAADGKKYKTDMLDSEGIEIISKYAEMNKAHPFMEGNGRSTRIWLDMMLKKHLKKCVDWSKIKKESYMNAMIISTADSSVLIQLIENALTTKINDREMFMKGIDYSYYYEE